MAWHEHYKQSGKSVIRTADLIIVRLPCDLRATVFNFPEFIL
jgi:hypothetical protein